MSAEDDMAWPTGTTIIPADPPSPLTARRIELIREPDDESWSVEIKMLDGRTFLTAGRDPLDALRNAAESWEELATLDAARAPDTGLRAVLETLIEAVTTYLDHSRSPNSWATDRGRLWSVIEDARAALASSPAPAGRGVRTECPLVGVHEHAFRGPHTFDEWYDGAAPAPAGLDVEVIGMLEVEHVSLRGPSHDVRGDARIGGYCEVCNAISAATRPAEESGT